MHTCSNGRKILASARITRLVVVLSGGALAAGAASLLQLQATLRSGVPTQFVHSLCYVRSVAAPDAKYCELG